MTVFTDKLDISSQISLYEYGVIRNPKTNKCVICTNWGDLNLPEWTVKPKVRVVYIDLDEVEGALLDINDGFFDFIGSTRSKELKVLNNENLAYHIFSLNQWEGYFHTY
jgi:hypothetical protein